MIRRHVTLAALCGVLSLPVMAETVQCPDLASAVRVGTCPSEDELKLTYVGYCSDNARIYRRDNEACLDYQDYRKMKNIALWESKDGEFNAYVSCDLPDARVREARASSVSVAKQSGMTRLMCGYGEGVTFVRRSRAECRVVNESGNACSGASCAASCDTP